MSSSFKDAKVFVATATVSTCDIVYTSRCESPFGLGPERAQNHSNFLSVFTSSIQDNYKNVKLLCPVTSGPRLKRIASPLPTCTPAYWLNLQLPFAVVRTVLLSVRGNNSLSAFLTPSYMVIIIR